MVNPRQARTLLAAVREIAPELEAFFGCMYYSALRPEEALNLEDVEYERPTKPGGRGMLPDRRYPNHQRQLDRYRGSGRAAWAQAPCRPGDPARASPPAAR